jgi:hypothetical protein
MDFEFSGASHFIGCYVRSGTFAHTCPQSVPKEADCCGHCTAASAATAQTVRHHVTG